MKWLIVLLGLLQMSFSRITTYNITDYGASTLSFDNSAAIKATIIAANGQQVIVPTGTFYTNRVTINEGIPINISGTGKLRAASTQQIGWHILQLENAPSVTVRNITLDGNIDSVYGTDQVGIILMKVWNCKNVTIDNVTVQNNKYLGVSFYRDTNVVVQNNTFSNTDVCTILQGGNYKMLFFNNYYNGTTSEGISVYGEIVSNVINRVDRNIQIYNNKVYNKVNSSAFHIRIGDSIVIRNNYVNNCTNGVGGENRIASRVEVVNNNIVNCKVGVLANYTNSRIDSNYILNCKSTGIWMGRDSLVSNNTITFNEIRDVNWAKNGDDGIRLTKVSNTAISFNKVFDTRSPLVTTSGIRIANTTSNISLRDNYLQGIIGIINANLATVNTNNTINLKIMPRIVNSIFVSPKLKPVLP